MVKEILECAGTKCHFQEVLEHLNKGREEDWKQTKDTRQRHWIHFWGNRTEQKRRERLSLAEYVSGIPLPLFLPAAHVECKKLRRFHSFRKSLFKLLSFDLLKVGPGKEVRRIKIGSHLALLVVLLIYIISEQRQADLPHYSR